MEVALASERRLIEQRQRSNEREDKYERDSDIFIIH
jgi:hypothetical protein